MTKDVDARNKCGHDEGRTVMSKLGKRMIASAKEARRIAQGSAKRAA